MIINAIDKDLKFGIRYRDKDGNRIDKTVSYHNFNPYFYILETAREMPFVKYTTKSGFGSFSQKIELFYERDGSVSLDGRLLKKVTWNPPAPYHCKALRNEWDETFEADVPFHYRYMVDEINEIPEYTLKKWYWDMEWQQGGEFDEMITCIVVYDNHEEKMWNFHWFPPTAVGDYSDTMFRHESEIEMLRSFVSWLDRCDPDMMISWFGSKFDLPKLIERLHANGLDPRKLSPYGDVDGVYYNEGLKLSRKVQNYSPIAQPIRGRILLNLDLAFERQWNDAQKGTLPSLALDYVAETVLGEKKMVSEKFPDKNEFFAKAWLEDSQTYMDYAKKDVELIARIDEENYISESVLALQRLLIAPFDACFYASNMGSVYFMRNANWKAPTGVQGPKTDYQGAMIYDPMTEGTNGLHLNVAAFDFAGLYPSMIIARNISWETKSDSPTAFAVNIATPRDFSIEEDFDFRYYKTDKLGMLPSALLHLKTLRNTYKKNMKESTTKDEYAKWNNNQLAVKRLMASFYGIVAYQGFGWADVDLAASITASARQAIREAAFKVMEL
tara:strand:- start:1681 stop:3348 length:1668 start_codon:yes stop_codon:yes gene_type:complete